MDIRTYIKTLRKQVELSADFELVERIEYAKAYKHGEEGLKRYRDRAISAEINRTYTQDAQLAILFNKDIHPDEYEAYQAFRAECKAKVDAEMQMLKIELEEALGNEEALYDY